MRTVKTIFTIPLLCVFNKLMGKNEYIEKKSKEEKIVEKEVRQRTLLEKLGFAQMVFDFYLAPVE